MTRNGEADGNGSARDVTDDAALYVATPRAPLQQQQQQHLSALDYSDRERLLYHITYLSTQLQRAQLQLQTHERSLLLLRAAVKAQAQTRHNNSNSADSNTDMDKSIDDKSDNSSSRSRDGAEATMNTLSSSTHNNKSKHSSRRHDDGDDDDKKDGSGVAARAGSVTHTAYVTLRVGAHDATAALLAARDEAEVHNMWRSALALFDPHIAQTQIQRLDSALAQLSVLREAEVQQLQRAERELIVLRTQHASAAQETAQLRSRCDALQQQCEQQHTALTSATLEVQRLRAAERQLTSRLSTLQGLLGDDAVALQHTRARIALARPHNDIDDDDGDHHHAAREVSHNNKSMLGSSSSSSSHSDAQGASAARAAHDALYEAAVRERQALWLNMYYEPMLIALDAGLTWLTDAAQLQRQQQQQQQVGDDDDDEQQQQQQRCVTRHAATQTHSHHTAGVTASAYNDDDKDDDDDDDVPVQLLSGDANEDAALLAALHAPLRDADALLLRHQHDELTTLRARVQELHSRLHDSDVAQQRLRVQCAAERQRSEAAARAHADELRRAYATVQHDRETVARALRAEVAAQVQRAFDAGRRYQRHQQQHHNIRHDGGSSGNGQAGRRHATRPQQQQQEQQQQHDNDSAKDSHARERVDDEGVVVCVTAPSVMRA